MERTLIEWSRLLAMVLRHKPQAVGIELDAHGWADVSAIVTAFSKMGVFTRAQEKIVARSYDKFFNLEERPETRLRALRENLL